MQHPNRSGLEKFSLGREKRPLETVEGDGIEDGLPEEKRRKVPALASVIVEALKVDSLQKLCSSLEPLLRRVVGEEVERALAKMVPSRLGARTPPRQIQGSDSSNLRLVFKTKLALPLFTGGKVEGEQGLPIHIVLEDASTGRVVTQGPESMVKLEVVVLDGDFGNEDEDWTEEEFESHVVKEREGKRPLLTGDLSVTLKDGIGTLGDLTFTDNSSWIRSRKFRLGVRPAAGFSEGIRIHGCRTEAFTVKDHRGELYKKHYPPALSDEVWRLDKIGKDGAFHKRLNENQICTVEDFLRFYVKDRQKLRHILGSGMSNKMWEGTVEHAKTCVLSGKLYVFYPQGSHNLGVIFNNIYELMGITSNGDYKSVDSLSENEKVYVDRLVKIAYDDWSSVVEYNSETLVPEKTHKSGGQRNQFGGRKAGTSLSGHGEQEHSSMYTHHMMPLQPVHYGAASGAASQNLEHRIDQSRYTNQDHQLPQASQMLSMQNDPSGPHSSSGSQQKAIVGNEATMTGLALGLPHSRASVFHPVPSSQVGTEWAPGRLQDPLTPAGHVDDYFTEDDIRAKSLELLENEEMQQLLRFHYPESFPVQGEDAYAYSSFNPSPSVSLGEDRVRSGRAYVGWLKLKAALRWGIFIRKIAAEKAGRRARLEEIDD